MSSTTKQGITKEVSTIIMDKRTALWFSSKLNDELRLALIMKVEEMDKPKIQPQQLTFNERKMQMISDVAKKAIDSINALEDDTKPLPPQTPEVVRRFKDTVNKLTTTEQSTISWEVKKFFTTTEHGI